MTAIKGLLSMILNGDYGPINDGLQKPLDNISLSAERQIHLINDLLNVSRLQTGKITFKLTEFSIRTEIEDIIKLLLPIAQPKAISITLKSNEYIQVQADIEWSRHIINNLIGNALKFTDKGSIFVKYYQDGDWIKIEVTDTGIGIDPADYNRLFGKFQQISTKVSNKLAGSGLGLFLSRELARKMGGELWLEKSTIGKGSTFVFALPKIGTPQAQHTKNLLAPEIEIALSEEKG